MSECTRVNKETGLAGEITFGVFTDPHYAAGKTYGNRYCGQSLAKMRDSVKCFRDKGVSFVVCLGDLIDSLDDIDLTRACMEEAREVAAGYAGEWHFVLGNHDLEPFTKEEFLHECGAGPARSYYSFDKAGYHFVVLDANFTAEGQAYARGSFDWTDSCLNRAQLEWLEADLARAGGRGTLVFIHQNLDHRLWKGATDPHIVQNAPEARGILEAAGNVLAVIQGHYHAGYYQQLNGIHYLTLQAMVEGDGRDQNAYAVLSVDSGQQIHVEGFGRQKSLLLRS